MVCCAMAVGFLAAATHLEAQASERIVIRSDNRPLASLRDAAAESMAVRPPFRPGVHEVPNFRGAPEPRSDMRPGPDPVRQEFYPATEMTSILSSFEGSGNEDNLFTLGFRVAPPDTDGAFGYHNGSPRFLQMINLITTIFDGNGNIVSGGGPFASNAFWSGAGGLCEAWNQGDPVALYDETNGRWLVSQFAFDDAFTVFAQCVAVSQTDDPTGAYNRYEFSFNSLGLPDYPKHGIVSDSITMIANLFSPPLFFFSGTFIGAMDKDAMYAGGTGTLVGFNLGSGQFGFLPADLDDPAGTASLTPALFATAMSRVRRFDIWQIDVDWNNPGAATRSRIADVRIANFDADLCAASREACIPQPNGGPALEAISDRLMHRLQIRDFGTHKSMLATHTVDADGAGTAGIRWYEMRQNPNNGRWSKHQEGTYAPSDGLHRWMPSIAMNAAGDIGLGFLVSSTSEQLGTRVITQSAAASGSSAFDGSEEVCRAGVTEQTGTARSGDYSATSVDPVSDRFWHTNEYGQLNTKSAGWGTYVCEFAGQAQPCNDSDGDGYGNPGSASCPAGPQTDCNDNNPNINPGVTEAGGLCNDFLDNDCDGLTDAADPGCQACTPEGGSCNSSSECCPGLKCKGGPGGKTCKP